MATSLNNPKSAVATWPVARGKASPPAQPERETESKLPPPTPEAAVLRRGSRNGDMLGVAWVHGSLQIAAFRRQTVTGTWVATAPVRTCEEFAGALDAAIVALKFTGTEIFFILAHDEFVHQAENAPSFSEKAALAYLRGRVERTEQEHEKPMLWVCQRAAAVKKEGNYILHLLPVAFYNQLHEIVLARRLDLTRILPLHVPLQLALTSLTETRDMPLLVATEAGSATAVLVGKTGSDMLFARTILASWSEDASRVAVEINRSMLYAKQQFGTNVDFLWLLGHGAEQAKAEIVVKCGRGTDVVVEDIGPVDWLKSISRLTPRHPINLVGSFLRKKRRGRFLRQLAVAGAWLALALLGFDAWSDEQKWTAESTRLLALEAERPALLAERDRLTARNAQVRADRAFIEAVVEDRLPPVARHFLAYAATQLPREARLTAFNVRWNEAEARWDFRIDGVILADPETAGSIISHLRRQLGSGPFRARIPEQLRAQNTVMIGGQQTQQTFFMEGWLFEN